MSFYSRLGWLENNGLWDTAIKEIVGSNFAKILLARNWDERLDVGSCEIGCTIGVFGSGLILDKGLRRLFRKAQDEGGTSRQWAVLGRSAALFSVVGSVMWAMPFIRNYLTARRTGSTHFTEVIGARQQSAASQKNLQDSIRDYRNKSLTILGTGASLAALAVTGSYAAIRKGIGFGPLTQLIEKRAFKNAFTLKDGEFKHLTGLPALLFWGLPSYGGLLQASRDKYERKEHLLKLAMFIGFFFVPPFLFKAYFNRQVQKTATVLPHLLQEGATSFKALTADLARHPVGSVEHQALERLMKSWKIKNVGGLGISLFLFGTIPQLMNIQLTKRRLARSHESLEDAALTSASTMPDMNPLSSLDPSSQKMSPGGFSPQQSYLWSMLHPFNHNRNQAASQQPAFGAAMLKRPNSLCSLY
jgi:hypothetical protein